MLKSLHETYIFIKKQKQKQKKPLMARHGGSHLYPSYSGGWDHGLMSQSQPRQKVSETPPNLKNKLYTSVILATGKHR
jgi:hypothetical protein